MDYTVRVWNGTDSILCQTADLPTCMHLFGVIFATDWTYADLISEQTGEVLCKWYNNPEYGVTTG